jgi:phosphotransferase system, enzyme I, PtsP
LLEKLRQVTQAVELAEGQQQTLNVLVNQVSDALKVEACSVFLADYELHQFVLMASKGLNQDAIGQVKLGFNEGLIGLIGQREEPIHLANASSHPAFYRIDEIKEELFNAFLGVPIIHQRKVLGVIIIQQSQARHFNLEEEAFLITLAAQLSVVLSNTALNKTFEINQDDSFVRNLRGVAASSGVAVGTAVVLFPMANIHNVPERKTDNIELELQKLGSAVKATHRQLDRMSRRMRGKVSTQELALFDAYQQILGSKGLGDEVEQVIAQGYWAATALRKVVQKHLNAFKLMQDPYLRERANDIEDLANRVLAQLLSSQSFSDELPENSIIIAENITAGMIAELPLAKVAAVVSLKGSSTSHAAILTKALKIPAVMAVESCPIEKIDGQELVVDGYTGQVFLRPSASLISQYKVLRDEELQLLSDLNQDKKLPNASKDGTKVKLMINSSIDSENIYSTPVIADGVGLYRTEMPFMQLEKFPSEAEQTAIYSRLLNQFNDKPITIRTLDIGGDKQLSYFPIKEENPFLGWRGVRVTLDHPDIFLVQMRAIFKASVGHSKLRIALPMVATINELDECYRLIHQAFDEVEQELFERKQIKPEINPHDNAIESCQEQLHWPQIGMILEVPASIFQLQSFSQKVDFISLGTNDLIQYLMAVDRNNARVKGLYSHFQPAVLKALKYIIAQSELANVEVQVCGEMAADPLAAILLIGMGYKELSMNVGSLAKVKRAIAHFSLTEMQQIVEQVLSFQTEEKVKSHLYKTMDSYGLSYLVRAGK